MDVYEIGVDLRDGVSDLAFVDAVDAYLGRLQRDGLIESWRLLRRKLGFGSGREFKLWIETRDLAQLDAAFAVVARRDGEVEADHHAVYSSVRNFEAALYRDFPDPQRVRGTNS